MKSNLCKVEEYFNELFEVDDLLKSAVSMICEIRMDENCSLYDDSDLEEINDIKQADIEYEGVELLLNREGMFPSFMLKFKLRGIECEYSYEIEYNSQGELLDDYFEKIETSDERKVCNGR